MRVRSRRVSVALLCITGLLSAPASAQLYWKSPDFRGPPDHRHRARHPDPAARRDDDRTQRRSGVDAARGAQLRGAAMPVRSLADDGFQLQSAARPPQQGAGRPTTSRCKGYFVRSAGKKASQNAINAAFDSFNTRTYSSFSSVFAQRGFCQVASNIGQEALMEPKGSLKITAHDRLQRVAQQPQAGGRPREPGSARPIQSGGRPASTGFPAQLFRPEGRAQEEGA